MEVIFNFIDTIIDGLLGFLPDSPFTEFIDQLGTIPFLGYLNWFLPIGTFNAIGASWLTAIGVFYVYQAILRWVKVVGD